MWLKLIFPSPSKIRILNLGPVYALSSLATTRELITFAQLGADLITPTQIERLCTKAKLS